MDSLNIQSSRPRHISPEEWAVRVDLAACYRLIAHFGWDDLILTHNSARVPGKPNHMLINPMGLMFDEITASNLIKVDLDGNQVEPSEYEPNYAGFVIHSAIYLGRPDVECVIHTHTEDVIAVSVQEEGLLPASQWAMWFYNRLAYHEYEGISLDLDERERLQASLGQQPVMVMRNHGLLATGGNVAEAFHRTYLFERAAAAQVKMQAAAAGAGTKVMLPPLDVQGRQVAQFDSGHAQLRGQREWPSLLRRCDKLDPTFRT